MPPGRAPNIFSDREPEHPIRCQSCNPITYGRTVNFTDTKTHSLKSLTCSYKLPRAGHGGGYRPRGGELGTGNIDKRNRRRRAILSVAHAERQPPRVLAGHKTKQPLWRQATRQLCTFWTRACGFLCVCKLAQRCYCSLRRMQRHSFARDIHMVF
jgi:hypothetical protein